MNGRRTNVPSYIVRPGDKVEVREGSRKRTYFKELRDYASERTVPEWLRRDAQTLGGEMVRIPERNDIDYSINEQLVVEYYSR